jgi:hypothetical protein
MKRRLTPHERYIMKKYTRIYPAHVLRLVVGNQEFNVGNDLNKEEAEWMRRMLAVALSRMIEAELATVLEPVVAKETAKEE